MTPVRRHFAVGDFLTVYPEGSEYALRIESVIARPDWKPRSVERPGSLIFPGSTIVFQDRHYEIVQLERANNGRVSYFLKPWEERFPIRTRHHYTEEECTRLYRSIQQQKSNNRYRLLILFFQPLVGLLPSEDQQRIQNRFSVSALWMTFLSALFFVLCTGLILVMIGAYFLGTNVRYGDKLVSYTPIAAYLFFESLLRLYHYGKLEEPMGSALLAVPLSIVRSIFRYIDPQTQREDRKKGIFKGSDAGLFSHAVDEVILVNAEDLKVLSMLPKEWNATVGILFEDRWYGLIDSRTIRENGKPLKYEYVIRLAPAGTYFRSTYNYSPDEVQHLYRRQRRLDLAAGVEAFSPLWGLLPAQEQQTLARFYNYEPLKYTRWSIVALGIFGVVNVIASALNFLAGIAGSSDVFWFLAAAYFVVESAQRRSKWKQKQISGSILGVFIKPFATKLLRGY